MEDIIGCTFEPSEKYGTFNFRPGAPNSLALRTSSDSLKSLPSWVHHHRLIFPFFQSLQSLQRRGRMPNLNLLPQPMRFPAHPQPDTKIGALPHGLPDTATLAAQDFDVDDRTGFMPPIPPLTRLPSEWETWEATLDSALTKRLKLYNGPGTTDDDRAESAAWRENVCKVGETPLLEWRPGSAS